MRLEYTWKKLFFWLQLNTSTQEMGLAMKARIGIRRLGLRRNLLLVWNRMILRIVYQCLGSSWYVVVRWGWVVVVARIVPLRREVLRVLSLRWGRKMLWRHDVCLGQRHAFALPRSIHLHHPSLTASLCSFASASAPWTWMGGFKSLLICIARRRNSQTIPIPHQWHVLSWWGCR